MDIAEVVDLHESTRLELWRKYAIESLLIYYEVIINVFLLKYCYTVSRDIIHYSIEIIKM